MLGSYRVLDLTDEKGQLCGRILGDLGADVVQVEPPGGDPCRRLGPFYQNVRAPEHSLTWFALNANKRGITLDLETLQGRDELTCQAVEADFLVESFPPGYLDRLGLGYEALGAINPRLVMVSISPFGQTGPHSGWATSDIVSMAMSGIMSVAGDPDRAPVRISEPQAYLHAGAHAAAAALIAHYHRLFTGEGQHVDVSIQEAVMWANSEVPQYWDLTGASRTRSGALRRQGKIHSRLHHPCKDGYVALNAGPGPQGGPKIYPLIRWMEREGMADGLGEMRDWTSEQWLEADEKVLTQDRIDLLEQAVDAFFSRYTKLELHEWSSRNGIEIYMVASPKEILESPQLASRGYFTGVHHPELGASLAYPTRWARSSVWSPAIARRAPLIGEHNNELLTPPPPSPAESPSSSPPSPFPLPPSPSLGPLRGLKVVEFAWVASGPMVGKHLAEHGAKVIRVESTTHLDTLRSLGPYKDGVYGVNRSGFFARYNSDKLGITLDLATSRGLAIARRLVADADVVTESFTAGTIVRLGLGYRVLRALNPRVIMLSTNIHGQTGPWADQGGWGGVGAAVAGVTHFTGWPDRPPIYLGVPYTDYVSPALAVAALMSALDYRARTGQGAYIEIAQAECAALFLSPALLDYAVNGRLRERMGNRSPQFAPHGVYRCQGEDRWCAIAVETDEQWQALGRAMGAPAWSQDSRLATAEGRLAAGDMDALVEEWTVRRSPEEVMETLQAVAVPAGLVQTGEDLLRDPQLAHRAHFVPLDHLEIGRHAGERVSYRLSHTPGRVVRGAPCLGQDSEQVLHEELGFTDHEIAEAIRLGALG